MGVKDRAFCKVFERDGTPKELEEFVKYHREFGGISRFVKIRYFYETMLNQEISDEEVMIKADEFGREVLKNLNGESALIQDSLDFIKKAHGQLPLHIASGALESELKQICIDLGIEHYFVSIHGSPTPKALLINEILKSNNYTPEKCYMFGDSITDYDSAKVNRVKFNGYNKESLRNIGEGYLDSFDEFVLE